MKSIAVIACLFLLASLSSCWYLRGTEECEEPIEETLFSIELSVRTVDGKSIFETGYSPDSLIAADIRTEQRVDVSFSEKTGNFSIRDFSYDEKAGDTVVCPTYLVQFRTGDIDTLKICYQLQFHPDYPDCHGSQFTGLNIFWNDRPLEYIVGGGHVVVGIEK